MDHVNQTLLEVFNTTLLEISNVFMFMYSRTATLRPFTPEQLPPEHLPPLNFVRINNDVFLVVIIRRFSQLVINRRSQGLQSPKFI